MPNLSSSLLSTATSTSVVLLLGSLALHRASKFSPKDLLWSHRHGVYLKNATECEDLCEKTKTKFWICDICYTFIFGKFYFVEKPGDLSALRESQRYYEICQTCFAKSCNPSSFDIEFNFNMKKEFFLLQQEVSKNEDLTHGNANILTENLDIVMEKLKAHEMEHQKQLLAKVKQECTEAGKIFYFSHTEIKEVDVFNELRIMLNKYFRTFDASGNLSAWETSHLCLMQSINLDASFKENEVEWAKTAVLAMHFIETMVNARYTKYWFKISHMMNWTRLDLPQYGFSIECPSIWKTNGVLKKSSEKVSFVMPGIGMSNHSLSVDVFQLGIASVADLKNYLMNILQAQLGVHLQDIRVLTEDMIECPTNFTDGSKVPMLILEVLAIKNLPNSSFILEPMVIHMWAGMAIANNRYYFILQMQFVNKSLRTIFDKQTMYRFFKSFRILDIQQPEHRYHLQTKCGLHLPLPDCVYSPKLILETTHPEVLTRKVGPGKIIATGISYREWAKDAARVGMNISLLKYQVLPEYLNQEKEVDIENLFFPKFMKLLNASERPITWLQDVILSKLKTTAKVCKFSSPTLLIRPLGTNVRATNIDTVACTIPYLGTIYVVIYESESPIPSSKTLEALVLESIQKVHIATPQFIDSLSQQRDVSIWYDNKSIRMKLDCSLRSHGLLSVSNATKDVEFDDPMKTKTIFYFLSSTTGISTRLTQQDFTEKKIETMEDLLKASMEQLKLEAEQSRLKLEVQEESIVYLKSTTVPIPAIRIKHAVRRPNGNAIHMLLTCVIIPSEVPFPSTSPASSPPPKREILLLCSSLIEDAANTITTESFMRNAISIHDSATFMLPCESHDYFFGRMKEIASDSVSGARPPLADVVIVTSETRPTV